MLPAASICVTGYHGQPLQHDSIKNEVCKIFLYVYVLWQVIRCVTQKGWGMMHVAQMQPPLLRTHLPPLITRTTTHYLASRPL